MPQSGSIPDIASAIEKQAPNKEALDSRLNVKPTGQPGWKKEPDLMVESGDKIDKALLGLRESLASTQVTSDTRIGVLDVKSDWKIRDAKTYSISYFSPDKGPQQNLLRADGSRRAELVNGEWKDLPPFGQSNDRKSFDLEQLPTSVVRKMTAPFRTGEPFWGPFLAALSRGEGGYQLKLETKSAQVQGKERQILRYVAERDRPSRGTIEVVIDAERSVPLTVRVSEARTGGGEDRVMWTAKWSFSGGKHNDSDFMLPSRP